MSALCQGLYHRGDWFVEGTGEIARLQDHLSLFQVAMDDTLL